MFTAGQSVRCGQDTNHCHFIIYRHVCGIDLSSVCLFVFLGIQGSQWKELLAQCLSACLSSFLCNYLCQ